MAMMDKTCYASGRKCLSEEYCSPFSEKCEKCVEICDIKSHNYHESDCNRFCAAFADDDSLRTQVRAIQHQQNVIFIILIVLLILIVTSNGIKILRWLKKKRCISTFFKNLSSKKQKNGKEQAVGTIANVMHMNEADRPASQIFSVTGVEGSTVLTTTTPISTRYPAEDNTTSTEYSYDNAGLQVSNVSSSNRGPFP